MVVKLEETQLKEVDLKRLLGGSNIYVGYPEGSTREDTNLTNAQIAFLNTEGTRPTNVSNSIKSLMGNSNNYSQAFLAYIKSHGEPRWHIPPRPFLIPSISKESDIISDKIKEIAIATIEKNNNVNELKNKLGILAVNLVQKFLRDYPSNELTPNAPSTIKKKGEDHPLKGKTGELIRGVTYIVEN